MLRKMNKPYYRKDGKISKNYSKNMENVITIENIYIACIIYTFPCLFDTLVLNIHYASTIETLIIISAEHTSFKFYKVFWGHVKSF